MRKLFFFILAAVTLTSCLDVPKNHTSPQIISSYFFCNGTDTLQVFEDENGFRLDTIQVGDTVRFTIEYNAVVNEIISASAKWDSTYADFYITNLDKIRDIMLESSDSANCVINMPLGYQAIALPYTYVAKKAGTPKLTFRAESTSKYSYMEIYLKTPIK